MHIDIDKLAQKSREFSYVHTRATVNFGRILFGKDACFHICHISGWPTCPPANRAGVVRKVRFPAKVIINLYPGKCEKPA